MKSLSDWVIYEDEHLLVLNKPPGLRVLPDGYRPELEHVRSLLEPTYGRLWIVHRLDKDTSGVLILARSAQAHRALNLQFDRRSVEKIYHGLVWGCPEWEQITLEYPLRVDGDRRHRTVVDFERGRPAVTVCRRLAISKEVALLAISPKTGRTHQIRAHLAYLGHPLLGDRLYGPSSAVFNRPTAVERVALHARSISIRHPHNEAPMQFEAPYPQDFQAWLREFALG